jgi:hypothetical protein
MPTLQTSIKLALPLLALAIVVWRFLRAWKSRPQSDAPLCARCRYNLTALASDHCPECGTNPADSGVIPAAHVALDHFRLPLWSFFMLFATLYCLVTFDFHFNYRHVETTVVCSCAGPAIGTCESRSTITGQGWSHILPRSLHMNCTVSTHNATIDYNYRTRTWTLSQPAGAPRQIVGNLSAADIESCFPTASIPSQVARSLQRHLNQASTRTEMSYDDSSPLHIEGEDSYSAHGNSVPTNLLRLASLDFLPWLFVILWALPIPYLRIWRHPILTGIPALDHLRRFAPATK